MNAPLNDAALDQLFRTARTVHGFRPEPVSDETIHALYDLLKWGPTAFNGQHARYVFVRSPEAKERLRKVLMPGNVPHTMEAPVTAIVAWDARFYEYLPRMFPAYDAKPLFENDSALAKDAAYRNSTLQGAYLMIAARALGLDVGPMSGFDAEALNREFFPDGRYKANFLCNLGYADPAKVFPRGPRFDFGEAASIL